MANELECLGSGKLVGGVLAGAVQKGGEEHGTAGGEGTARLPEVEGGGVAVAAGLFPRGSGGDGVERETDLDQLLARGGHGAAFLNHR